MIGISRDVEILYEHCLGVGSFGAVYKCKFLGVMAAAKVFQSKVNKEGVEQEANLFSKLLHPNVVQFIGIWSQGKAACHCFGAHEHGLEDILRRPEEEKREGEW